MEHGASSSRQFVHGDFVLVTSHLTFRRRQFKQALVARLRDWPLDLSPDFGGEDMASHLTEV